MDIQSVQTSYARWAPVYDRTFGAVTKAGRRAAVNYINKRQGSVLEIGVGTGLSLRHYATHLQVTGIDFSREMLGKAQAKARESNFSHIKELRQMDARTLDFPDNHFDTIAAMHVLSVVPEPEKVMTEIARVCKPGGRVVITNHFARSKGILGLATKVTAPLANTIGWHADFEIETILKEKVFSVELQKPLPPARMMTLLILNKDECPASD